MIFRMGLEEIFKCPESYRNTFGVVQPVDGQYDFFVGTSEFLVKKFPGKTFRMLFKADFFTSLRKLFIVNSQGEEVNLHNPLFQVDAVEDSYI